MRYKIRLSILLIISILAGCSLPLENQNQNFKGDDDTLGLAPDFSYEVAEQLPYILVNQLGYLSRGKKTAILQYKMVAFYHLVGLNW